MLDDWISRLKFGLLHDDTNISALLALLLLCAPAILAYAKGRRVTKLGAFAFTAIAEAFYLTVFDVRSAMICWCIAWAFALSSVCGRSQVINEN